MILNEIKQKTSETAKLFFIYNAIMISFFFRVKGKGGVYKKKQSKKRFKMADIV